MENPVPKCTVPVQIGSEVVKFELRPDRHCSRVPVRVWKLFHAVLKPINPSEVVSDEELTGCIGMCSVQFSVRSCKLTRHLILVCREPEPTLGLSTLMQLQLVYNFGEGNFRLASEIPPPPVKQNYCNEQFKYQERKFQQKDGFSAAQTTEDFFTDEMGFCGEQRRTHDPTPFTQTQAGHQNKQWFDQSTSMYEAKPYHENNSPAVYSKFIENENNLFKGSASQTDGQHKQWFGESSSMYAAKPYDENMTSAVNNKDVENENNLFKSSVDIVPWSQDLFEEQDKQKTMEVQHSKNYAHHQYSQPVADRRSGTPFFQQDHVRNDFKQYY